MARHIDPVKARNCAFLNLFGTPGLGSLMGGRILPGIGQLALALTGFCFFIYWFIKMFSGLFSESGDLSHSYGGWGWAGAGLFAAAWVWSLVTSLGLLRDAKKSATVEVSAEPPLIH